MTANPFQSNLDDPRWDRFSALLPAVEEWVALAATLLRQARDVGGQAKAGDGEQQARALAGAIEDGATDATETLDHAAPTIRKADGVPIAALPTDIDERERLWSIHEAYEACRERLTSDQWPAVCLRYRDGLTQAQIAIVLKKSRSAVHGLLERARIRKEIFQRERREESYRMARKYPTP